MQLEHAEHTLETIRTLMERSQRYEHISGYSGLVAGSTVLASCSLIRAGILPFAEKTVFVSVWTTVFLIAFSCHLALTFARARQRGEPVWSRQARTVLCAVLPSFLGSLFVTVLLWRLDRLDVLPAFWLLLYGCGALATSFFAPRSILVLGAGCLALAGAFLIFAPDRPLLTMALGFGTTHLAFGGWVVYSDWREEQELSQWTKEIAPWDQNSAP